MQILSWWVFDRQVFEVIFTLEHVCNSGLIFLQLIFNFSVGNCFTCASCSFSYLNSSLLAHPSTVLHSSVWADTTWQGLILLPVLLPFLYLDLLLPSYFTAKVGSPPGVACQMVFFLWIEVGCHRQQLISIFSPCEAITLTPGKFRGQQKQGALPAACARCCSSCPLSGLLWLLPGVTAHALCPDESFLHPAMQGCVPDGGNRGRGRCDENVIFRLGNKVPA